MIAWHRLFGLALQDLLATSPYQVEVEKDLSVQQQRIDIIIIEQGDSNGAVVIDLPDGLDNLAKHNLITYKSLRQPLEEWTFSRSHAPRGNAAETLRVERGIRGTQSVHSAFPRGA